ncbi:LysR family transcriptional regulator [Marinihelvus fidelis]|uniref:LysR family transcriptional regulator n=1 Tax=Marinihelvus fidelis TaxID=2613842 RepID=A0A5N0TDU7_9GAMM|nr:LysR substrate-binding domain-containing protein [Marinihelvus fidelis]KAA9132634.1 LysR family transcriptional regulator [Marinihelvus fidelis]
MDPSSQFSGRKVSMRGLRTFCVAARHRTLRHAADELFITASAVSHQIKKLESEMHVQLFVRQGRTLDLTPAGAMLYEQASEAISRLEDVTARVQAEYARGTLRVSVQPFFASELLMPRLGDFREQHPDIDLLLDASDESTHKHPVAADVSIRLFRQRPGQFDAEKLFPLRLVPACSPAFLDKLGGDPWADPRKLPIVVHSGRPEAWASWSARSGIPVPVGANIVRLDSMSAVVRAAERGLGAALVPMPLAGPSFEAGLLRQLSDVELELPDAYWFATRRNLRDRADIRDFRAWVLQNFEHES